MKILYDHQIFIAQTYGGISRYFYELNKEFKDIDNISTSISLLLSNNYYISKMNLVINSFLPNYFKHHHITNPLNKIYSILQLKRQKFDVFHPTYYDMYFTKYTDKPFVFTAHDMIHEKFKDMFNLDDKTTEYKKYLTQKATKIIAVSENTKKDLVQIFGIDQSKIEVVYHGQSMFGNKSMLNNIKLKIPSKYILYVGARHMYKNFNRFLYALEKLFLEHLDLSLVCTGGNGFNDEEKKIIDSMNLSKRVYHYNLDDEQLAYLYKNAQLFVFPSLYEGFGIPILEAFACKCPLVCSNTSCFPEIATDGAVYFDPYSIESMQESINKVLKDKELRKKIISKGTERLKYFSWKKTAYNMKKVYESIL